MATREIYDRLMTSVRLGRMEFLERVLSRLILGALGVGVFVAVTFVLFALFYQKGDPGAELYCGRKLSALLPEPRRSAASA